MNLPRAHWHRQSFYILNEVGLDLVAVQNNEGKLKIPTLTRRGSPNLDQVPSRRRHPLKGYLCLTTGG